MTGKLYHFTRAIVGRSRPPKWSNRMLDEGDAGMSQTSVSPLTQPSEHATGGKSHDYPSDEKRANDAQLG
ncbi:MAG TPA: hypothetical protein VKX96_17000 [Chloroflexota bacterium]|nr:hypothetical protein [Chloroflexota bacterium]